MYSYAYIMGTITKYKPIKKDNNLTLEVTLKVTENDYTDNYTITLDSYMAEITLENLNATTKRTVGIKCHLRCINNIITLVPDRLMFIGE